MAHCVTHNITFDPQREWCIYCGKPKTAEPAAVESTSTNIARDEICALIDAAIALCEGYLGGLAIPKLLVAKRKLSSVA